MKKSIFTLLLAAGIFTVSCGDRKTNSENEIQLEEREGPVVEGKDMIPADDSDSAQNQAEIVSAKQVVNKYFSALDRGDFTEAYEQMSRSSDRGTSSEFAEENAGIETITVSFTQDATVNTNTNGTEIELPLRYTVKTKNENTETYSGSAIVLKASGEDSDYQILKMNVTREDS
ncbi:MAG: hypothetical protein COA80_00165 [Leeuwenhoekiella sp.]|nr:MAG: hypothetical protein COA80_00165 [Leeuwenhoekiella sp.]